MADQENYGGFSPSSYGAPAPFVPPPAQPFPAGMPVPAPMLRPLSTGEVLDRTFSTYKQRFWLFVGIGTVPAIVLVLSSIGRLLYLTLTHHANGFQPGAAPQAMADAMSTIFLVQLYFLPATILFLISYGISHAAIVDAVTRVSQGTAVTAASAYGAIRGKWLRWTGIILRQFWSFGWPMLPALLLLGVAVGMAAMRKNPVLMAAIVFLVWILLIGAVVLGAINFIRNALAMPAGVQENIGVNAAMRRSKALVAGRKGRIFLTLLLVYALQMVVGAVQVPLLFAATAARGAAHVLLQAIALVIQFITVALVTPVASIAFTYFYIDERVRREGLDIEWMMQRNFHPQPANEPHVGEGI